jgi:hypothetical protein
MAAHHPAPSERIRPAAVINPVRTAARRVLSAAAHKINWQKSYMSQSRDDEANRLLAQWGRLLQVRHEVPSSGAVSYRLIYRSSWNAPEQFYDAIGLWNPLRAACSISRRATWQSADITRRRYRCSLASRCQA